MRFVLLLLGFLVFVQSSFSDVGPYLEDEEMEQRARRILDGVVIDMHSRKVDSFAVSGLVEEVEVFEETYFFKVVTVIRGDFERGEVLKLTREVAIPTTNTVLPIEIGSKFRYFSSVPEDPFYEKEKKMGRVVNPMSKDLIRPHLFGKNVEIENDAELVPHQRLDKVEEQKIETSNIFEGKEGEARLVKEPDGDDKKYSWGLFVVVGLLALGFLILWLWKPKR